MYYLLGATAFVILLALLYFIRMPVTEKPGDKSPAPLPGLTHCPLCGESLSGTRLYAKQLEYPDHRLVLEIRGCGHCYKGGHVFDRVCPRCGKRLGMDDAVMASSQQTGTVRKVHIQGCRYCYKR